PRCQERIDQRGEQCGPPRQRVDKHVLVISMRPAADRAKPVERRGPHSGGGLAPPLISSAASGTADSSELIAAWTRACSAVSHIRTSTENAPAAGTVFATVPDDSAVGV